MDVAPGSGRLGFSGHIATIEQLEAEQHRRIGAAQRMLAVIVVVGTAVGFVAYRQLAGFQLTGVLAAVPAAAASGVFSLVSLPIKSWHAASRHLQALQDLRVGFALLKHSPNRARIRMLDDALSALVKAAYGVPGG